MENINNKPDVYNYGGWTTLDTIEIGDVIGGIEIKTELQRDYAKAMHTVLIALWNVADNTRETYDEVRSK